MNEKRIILGIDPGTNILGYGAVELTGQKIAMKDVGILHMKSETDAHEKLRLIYNHISSLIKELKPESMAIEAPFFGKNVQSMLKLGRAQGVAIAAAVQYQIPVFEYSPKKIKQSITGNGNASKEQVSSMICRLLSLNEAPAFLDETDALATAVCHILQGGKIEKTTATKKGKTDSWSSFIKENPKRMMK
jgi:crossover junction endodeoxyribonuclease RuvC